MIKFSKVKTIAAVASACAALFAAAPASAYVYAVSKLEIKDLDIGIFATRANPSLPYGPDVGAATNYSFNLSNNATYTPLGGTTLLSSGAGGCTGNIATNTTFCANPGATPGPNLSAGVANAPGLTSARAEDNFAVLGVIPGQSYSNADSQITSAKLVEATGPNPIAAKTSTVQIAESLLNQNGQASSNTEVKSTTTLVTSFVTSTTTDLKVSFEALLTLAGEIDDLMNGAYTSAASSSVIFSLSRNDSNQRWEWKPGSGFGCITNVAGSCAIDAEEGNLNASDSASATPESYDLSFTDFGKFGLTISNLAAGTYSLSLTANTTSAVDRNAVPEPGSLALAGLALLGLGAVGRRPRKK